MRRVICAKYYYWGR